MNIWSIQQQQHNGIWFIRAGDMNRCDAERWFVHYGMQEPGVPIRLMHGITLVKLANVKREQIS